MPAIAGFTYIKAGLVGVAALSPLHADSDLMSASFFIERL
jgi:hypothetical protein